MKCPHCGHSPRQSKRIAVLAADSDTASMSEQQVREHYKRTAPFEDLKFWIAHNRYYPIVDREFSKLLDLFDAADQLTINRADFYRRLETAKALWRRASNQRERSLGIPAIGTVEWSEALKTVQGELIAPQTETAA